MVTEVGPPDIITSMATRQCRDCGEEYRPDAQASTCSDCGGPIEWTDDPSADETPRTSPEGSYRAVFGGDRPATLEPAAKRLGMAGIPFVVRSGGRSHPWLLWVPSDHVETAREHLAELPGAMVATHEAYDPEKGYGRCPACDAEVTPDRPDCPGCGLAVGPVDSIPCKSCGAACDPNVETCPSCGH
jgi:hypothetical protein